MSTIKLYKLTSGEEIVANVKGTAPEYIEIDDAVTLVYQQAPGGKMTVGFAPFMPYSEGSIILYSRTIAGTSDVTEQLLTEYQRVFSKIEIAPASALASLN